MSQSTPNHADFMEGRAVFPLPAGLPRSVYGPPGTPGHKRSGQDLASTLSARALVERIPAGALLVLPDGIFFNRYVEQMIGYSVDELPTLDVWFTALYGENSDEILKFYLDMREAGFPHAPTVPLRRKDGSTRYIEFAAHRDNTDEIWLLHDVTERLRAEQENRDSRALLEAISRAQSQFIAEVDARDVFAGLLDDLLQLSQSKYGFIAEVRRTAESHAYLQPLACTDLACDCAGGDSSPCQSVPCLGFDDLNKLFGECVTTGQPVVVNYPLHDRGAVELSGHPALNSLLGLPFYHGREAIGVVGIANRQGGYDELLVKYLQPFLATCANLVEASRLVRSRQEARKSLRESNARLQAAFENVPFDFWVMDATGRYVMQNPASFEHWGNLIGRRPSDTSLPAEMLATWQQNNRRAFAGETVKMEHDFLWNGQRKVAYNVVSPIRDGDQVLGILGINVDITERRETEDRLRESEQRLRQVLENMPVLLSAIGDDRSLLLWTRENERVTGYRADEVLGNPAVFELLYPDAEYRQRMLTEWRARGDHYFNWEWTLTCKDGSQRVISWSNVSALAPVTGWSSWGIGVDVTEQKQSEIALRESESRFRLAAEAVNGTIYDYDSRTGRIYRSRGLFDIIGYQPEELPVTAEAWIGRIHPDDLSTARSRIFSAWEHGENYDLEYRVRHQAGHYVHVWDKGIAIRDAGNGNLRVVGCVIDVTEQKRAGEWLQQLTQERADLLERLQMMLDRMPIGCILSDERFRFTYWNQAAERIFGYAFDEVRGRHPFQIIVPEIRKPFVTELFANIAAGKLVAETVGEAVTKDGRSIFCEWSNVPLHDSAGKFVGLLSMCQDVTQREINEQRLRQQDADLTHIARLSTMGEMVAGIAHEITQPLHAICNYAGACNALLEDGELTNVSTLREWTTKIGELANRSGEIIWRLRNFSRKAEGNRAKVDLNELARESAELVMFEARRGNIQLDFELAELPCTHADRIQIQQVLVNLLRNAFEAVRHDCSAGVESSPRQPINRARAGRVVLSTSMLSDEVQIAVADNGPGLDQIMAGKLFQAFNTTKPEGMGMGLAISRTIVEAHGGKIWAEPNHPTGAIFRFTIPLCEVASDEPNLLPLRTG